MDIEGKATGESAGGIGGIDRLRQYLISQNVSYLSMSSKPGLSSLVCVCFHVVFALVSSPDPTLEEGKGSDDFGQNAWSSWQPAEEFACPNQITALV